MDSNSLTYILFAIYLICLGSFLFFSQRQELFNKLMLFRALFPSWRFFDEFSFQPILFIRAAQAGSDLGDWEEAIIPQKRHFFNIFSNPQGNLTLAYNNLVSEAINNLKLEDKSENIDISEKTEFKLINKIVTQKLREKGLYYKGMKYQYKICISSTLSDKVQDDDLLVSKVIEV